MAKRAPDPLAPRRCASQRRAEVLVDAVVQAARCILEEEGADALTTNRVAERAGVSVGSLYHYFPNKDSIVAAVFEERVAEIVDETVRMAGSLHLEDLPVEEALARYVEILIERRTRFAGLHREFVEQWGSRIELTHREAPGGGTYYDVTHRWICSVVERERDRLDVEDVDAAVHVVLHMCEGIGRAVMEERLPAIPRERLCADVTRAMLACLGFDASADAARSRPSLVARRSGVRR